MTPESPASSTPDNLARKRVGVLISGRGSNMVALQEAASAPNCPYELVVVVSNRPQAPGLAYAKTQGIATLALDHTLFRSREEFDDQIHRVMSASKVDIIACAGFMRLMTEGLIERWHNRMINIHPALLPLFKGLDTHTRALKSGVKISGCTVHAVRPKMDEGPILGQAAVAVLPDDTPERLAARVLKAEHKLYPEVLRLFASDQIKIAGDRVINAYQGCETADEAIYSPQPTNR